MLNVGEAPEVEAGAEPLVSAESPKRVYLTSAHVRAMYGNISDMTLWRWCHHPEVRFPQPIKIGGRKFFDRDEVEAWDRQRTAARAALRGACAAA